MRIRIAASVLGLLVAFACFAVDDGELWEVTMQMNIPGMPAGMAGMGQAPQRVCNGKDPKEDATRRPDMEKCKVVDTKQTATRFTLTMSCPEGQAVIDQTYNAARTEYKGTMTMKSKDGDMVMNMSGRKLGTCDVQQARKEREEKGAKMKAQGEAQMAAITRQQAEAKSKTAVDVTKSCTEASAGMDMGKFPICYQPNGVNHPACTDKQAIEYVLPKEAKTVCDAKKVEYCQKLQTESGFAKVARGFEFEKKEEPASVRTRLTEEMKGASAFCSLQPAKFVADVCARATKAGSLDFLQGYCPAEYRQIVAAKCAQALKDEALDFLGERCPAEGKQLGAKMCPKALQTSAWNYVRRHCPSDKQAVFKKNCAGREYTALPDRKFANMCMTLGAAGDYEDDDVPGTQGQRKAATAAPATAPAPAAAKKPSTAEQVQQGFGKGLDQIKGLFGR